MSTKSWSAATVSSSRRDTGGASCFLRWRQNTGGIAKRFLEQTCHKAGLPENSWKDDDTKIEIFSAEIIH